MPRPSSLRWLLVPVLVAAVAACGDDDDSSSSAPPAVCSPYLDVSAAFSSDAPDPARITTLLDAIDANTPSDLSQPLGTMVGAARTVLASGGQATEPFETAEFASAQSTVDAWMFDKCAFDHRLRVEARDFQFDGLDTDSLGTGRLGLLLTNKGTEAHEISIYRRADGVTESWDDLLARPPEELEGKVAEVGSTFAGLPDAHGLLVGQLTPGEYIAVCFIPGGTSMTADGDVTEGTGAPHHTLGMRREFRVD